MAYSGDMAANQKVLATPAVQRLSGNLMDQVSRLRAIRNRLESHGDSILGSEPREVAKAPGGELGGGISLEAAIRNVADAIASIETQLDRIGT